MHKRKQVSVHRHTTPAHWHFRSSEVCLIAVFFCFEINVMISHAAWGPNCCYDVVTWQLNLGRFQMPLHGCHRGRKAAPNLQSCPNWTDKLISSSSRFFAIGEAKIITGGLPNTAAWHFRWRVRTTETVRYSKCLRPRRRNIWGSFRVTFISSQCNMLKRR